MHTSKPACDDEICILRQAESYSMQRQLKKAQQEGRTAHAGLASAQAVAAELERSFLAERRQRRKVVLCCGGHRPMLPPALMQMCRVHMLRVHSPVLTGTAVLVRRTSSCSCCAATSECWPGCDRAQALKWRPCSARSRVRWRCTAGQISDRRPSSSRRHLVLRHHR